MLKIPTCTVRMVKNTTMVMRQLRRLFQMSPGEPTKRLPKDLDFCVASTREARREAGFVAVFAATVLLPCARAVADAEARVMGWPVGFLPEFLSEVVIFYA